MERYQPILSEPTDGSAQAGDLIGFSEMSLRAGEIGRLSKIKPPSNVKSGLQFPIVYKVNLLPHPHELLHVLG